MIESRQELAEFALRQLGGGVINIEVSDDQLEDCVDMAIEYYREYHYDGIERDFIRCKVTPTTLTVSSTSGISVGDIVVGQTSGATSTVSSIVSPTQFSVSRIANLMMYSTNEILTIGSGTQTVTKVVPGVLDTGYFELEDSVVGVIKVLNISSVLSSGDYLFDPKFQIMQSQLSNIGSMNMQYFYGAMSYLAELDFVLRKEKSFRFNRRQNKLHLDINWNNDVKMNDIIVIECNRYVDDDLYSEVLNDRWLRSYTTALIKKQNGINTKKYDGMMLPGGLRYNGQQMYNEAVEEIARLEEDLRNNEEPLDFLIG